MASIEAAIVAALKANVGVATFAAARVFISGAQQGGTYPFVTVQRISTQTAANLNGASHLDWPRIQIDVWSQTALEALNTGEAIRSAIDCTELTFSGVTFTATFQDQRGPAPDETTRNFSVSQDYLAFHERT